MAFSIIKYLSVNILLIIKIAISTGSKLVKSFEKELNDSATKMFDSVHCLLLFLNENQDTLRSPDLWTQYRVTDE